MNWSSLGFGLNDSVFALAASGSDIYAGGYFTNAGGAPANYVAKWNGSSWSSLGSGMNTGGPVLALAVAGNYLYAGGFFTNAGGVPAKYIARWDGTNWSAVGSGLNDFGPVQTFAVSGSNLYAASFGVAKWDGTNWSNLGVAMDHPIEALAISGSNLYAGGLFDLDANGTNLLNQIAKWDGTNWSALGSGTSHPISGPPYGGPYVFALAVSGSDLFVGGEFSQAGDKVSCYAAKVLIEPGDWLRIQRNGRNANTLTYVGIPGSNYLIQFTTNIANNTWLALATNTPTTYGVGTVTDTNPTNSQRFYRIRSP
jgi:hypothetical protein